MGKYMKNSKLKTSSQLPSNTNTTSLGVRTRAKTLALQTLHTTDSPDNSSSYLQLRSRRLQKPPPPLKRVNRGSDETNRNLKELSGHRVTSRFRSSSNSEAWSFSRYDLYETGCKNLAFVADEELLNGEDVEASFGENFLDAEQRRRSTRESTPCSAVRDLNVIETPGSATRSSKQSSAVQGPTQIPISEINSTKQEIEDFFSSIERQEQQLYMDKYNFDFVNDKPLPGGFEWEQVIA